MARAAQDALAVLRGLQLIAEALCREQSAHCKHLWTQSSIRELLEANAKQSGEYLQKVSQNPGEELQRLQQLLRETRERSCVVVEGVRQLANSKVPAELKMSQQPFGGMGAGGAMGGANAAGGVGGAGGADGMSGAAGSVPLHVDAANLDISSITLKELEEILSKRHRNREISLRTASTESKQVKDAAPAAAPAQSTTEVKPTKPPSAAPTSGGSTTNMTSTNLATDTTPTVLTSATSASAPATPTAARADTVYLENMMKMIAGSTDAKTSASTAGGEAATATIALPALSKVAKQRRVPSSRFGRMASFGGLFAGLGIGTINELTKGALGLGGSKNVKEALFSPANAERIVDTLCKVRGAALKIGQILSIQDSNVVSPQLAKAFERVRQAADYMPDWQVERVMTEQLGANWRDLLRSFDEKPFAAASIGQVHRATLKNGMEVAIKIQYPGVAQSIESDIDNLVGMLKVWDVFPEGFFIDNVVKVAKRELTWEVDYEREAAYTEKFREMITPYSEYYVPLVIKELTTANVLTTELVPGVPLDKCFELSYEHRHHIASSVLKLCLRELFELECMQTDPNWSNFLYDAQTKRLMLIDFGSTRFYQKQFIKNYRQVIMHAANNNRDGVLKMSREMGFLTGYETKQMEEAHVDAVMILGEMFRYDGDFDFGQQNTTERIAHLVPTMVAQRLCPPPEEIYSIHRKLSGIFLLCARLKVRLNCRPYYEDIIVKKFKE